MFGTMDVGVLLAGSVLGIIMGLGIVVFLVHSAIHAVRVDPDHGQYDSLYTPVHVSPLTRYESQRAHLHAIVRDTEVAEW